MCASVGDRDDAALDPSLMRLRTIPGAELAVLPGSSHLTNLEDPALFNRLVERFHERVAAASYLG